MMWQDICLTACQWVFGLALIPAIRAQEKPPMVTSLTTALCLFVMAAAFHSLGLYMSTAACVAVGIIWTGLLLQKVKQVTGSAP